LHELRAFVGLGQSSVSRHEEGVARLRESEVGRVVSAQAAAYRKAERQVGETLDRNPLDGETAQIAQPLQGFLRSDAAVPDVAEKRIRDLDRREIERREVAIG